ncbi:MAG: hypothetical protein K940chlam7_00916 [Chlamydiae bacterium]|nr:hypothetical protein [Chlamydiota bacterium]
MRILIISTFFPPLNSIASLRPYSWAKYWTLEGHDVTVLTTQKQQDPTLALNLPNPGFELIEVPLPSLFHSLKNRCQATSKKDENNPEKKGNTPQINFLQTLRRKKGIFHACRMPDITHFWTRPAFRKIREKGNWDLVVSSSGPYTVHIVAEKLKKSGFAKKWVADFRDRWSDNHIFPGLFPFTLVEKIWEKKLMKSADAITTVSTPYSNTFKAKYGSEKVHVIENGFDPEDLENIPKIPIFLDDGKFRIIYTGSLFLRNQNPEPFFKTIAKMKQDPKNQNLLEKLEVIFVGPEQQTLERLINQYQIEKWVKTLGFVNREVSLRMQRDAHAVLFFPWNDSTVDGINTGKVFEYLYSKTPILCVGEKNHQSIQQLIHESKTGVTLTTTEEIESYLIDHLQNTSKQPTTIPSSILERYSRKELASQFLKISKLL